MRKTWFALVPALLVTSSLAANVLWDHTAQAEGTASKVRAVNLDKILQKSPKALAITQDFQRFQQQKQDELRKEQEGLEKEQRKLSANSPQEEINAYGKKMQDAAQHVQTAELETQQRFAQTRQKLLEALRPTFEAYANNNSVGMLVDSNTGGVLYVAPSWDATSDVLALVK
ncbi:MAG TPA: OmpH family outer membrane protein [Polyangiaceae bacterium]|jgi:Skp family chaperone for outer membrane proteins|nr:OmpH family outer membrane protein [Polyangiaceae bacterium]